MNILFVAPRIPYPLDTGGKIRTFNILKQIRDAGHKVTLLSFVFKKGEEAQGPFREMGIMVVGVPGSDRLSLAVAHRAFVRRLPVSVAKYRHPVMAGVLVRLIREQKIDVVHFDHIHMAQYLDLCPGVPTVIDEHNVEALILKRLRDNEKGYFKKLLYSREYEAMSRLERRLCLKAFRVLTVSDEDKAKLQGLCDGKAKIEVIPNGVDVEYFRSPVPFGEACALTSHLSPEDSLVFTGSMDWVPNADAITWFCRDILPLIWQKRPEVKLYVVGKNPPLGLVDLGKKDARIIVTGSVPDVRPYVERSKVFVVPLRIGGGTRLKILEAMAMRKPVVSTGIGAEGIDAWTGQDIYIADSPHKFAEKTLELLGDDAACEKLGKNGERLVHAQYDWKIIGKKLARVYQELR
jgi:sugar transferase (PEP-CTERM/EpsH1 system associated)